MKIKEILPGVEENIPLANHTTYKIGGPAKYFFIAKTENQLINALAVARKINIPIFILGGGSNVLVSDKGFNGLVVQIKISHIEIGKSGVIKAGAGVVLNNLVHLTTNEGLSGLEWAAGIPGITLGGAIYGHAQAFGAKISDLIEKVLVVDIKNLEIKELSKEQCKFSLKNSIFKKNKNLVIVSAILKLQKKNVSEIKDKIKEFLNYRKTNHPLNFPSAGSVFVNPEAKIKNKKLLLEFPELKEYNDSGVLRAGYLIAKAGLAGKKIGDAQISEKHCNFIINLGGRPGVPSGSHPAEDVLSLINLIKNKVNKKFGIKLEPEVQFVGFK